MPNFLIEQRETWEAIVIYAVEAENEEIAREMTQTGTYKYSEHEIINRDCRRIIDVRQTHIN